MGIKGVFFEDVLEVLACLGLLEGLAEPTGSARAHHHDKHHHLYLSGAFKAVEKISR